VQREPVSNSPERARAQSADSPAPAPYTAKPDPGMPAGVVRGLMQAVAGVNAMITNLSVGLPMEQAFRIWQFTDAELHAIEKPGTPLIEKYAPMLESWGLEIELAGILGPILIAKIFAIITAKRLLDAQAKEAKPAAQADKPAASPTPIRAVPPAQPHTPSHDSTEAPAPASHLPSAFAPELNREMQAVGASL
jgi:hypothetical protein